MFAGSAFTNDANDKMTTYGTDPAAIAAALDRIDTPLRDRITVAETRYSLNEIETYAEQARARLDAAGITASAGVQFGVDAVVVAARNAGRRTRRHHSDRSDERSR